MLDLVFVCFFMRYRTRPGHFFGGIGIALGAVGSLILAYMLGLKVFANADIGSRPLLFLGFFLVIAGIQMVTSGVLAQLLTRIYYETGSSRAYLARPSEQPARESGWRRDEGAEQG